MSPQPKKSKKKSKNCVSHDRIVLAGNEYDARVAPSIHQKVRVVSQPPVGAFDASYQRGPQLGLGAFSKVFMGVHKASHQQYAIKKIDRSKTLWGDRDSLEDEINNLIIVRDGPNIVQLYEVYEEESHCYLIMELMRGGELFDKILEEKTFSEHESRECIRGIITGLAYMHKKRIAHRDLKPENLLLQTPENGHAVDLASQIKLADFGFAKKVSTENGCRTLCGTPGYLAPEILERFPSYDVKCDLWSVGVILFLLLGGYLPFEDEDEDRVFEKTREGQYYFHPSYWKNISTHAKNFVTHLLTVNPKKRYTSTEALKDEWMTKKLDKLARQKSTEDEDQHKQKKKNKKKVDVKKAKEKFRAAVAAVLAGNRLKLLNEQFDGYLERKGTDSTKRLTGGETCKKKKKEKFVEDSTTGKPCKDFYDFHEILGEGGYAAVYRATHKRTNEEYAVKDIDTSVLEENSKMALKDEIAALKLLRGGPFIIRIYDVFEEPLNTFMVMEMCRGGDLLTRVTEKEYYTEREARKTCKILFQAMDYIHKMKIAHRDIKPENVLMVELDDDHSIKIADFGFAKRVHKKNCLRTLCGTAQYVAPEVLDLHSPGYDQCADMWSVGVVVYILLGGYAPFEGPVHELAQVICKGDYEFHDKYWSDISNEAKQMISQLLEVDSEKRLSAEEALQCSWMMIEEESLTVKDLSGAQAALQNRKPTTEDHVLNPLSKTDSLSISFTSGLGTMEEVMSRKAKRTNTNEGLLGVIEEDGSLQEEAEGFQDFEQLYTWGRLIEQGDFWISREARNNKTKEVVAVKSVARNGLESEEAVALQDEIKVLQLLQECPRVIKLHEVFEEPDYTYIVFERLRGGQLIDRIGEKKYYTEDEARVVTKNLLLAIEYCHNRRIAIRNIKLENIILTEHGNVVDVKLCDFGMAKRVLYPNGLSTQCGTEGYVAPEILEHRPEYDVQCDMWSLGVVLYILLGGYRPFRGEGNDLIRKIRYGEFKFHKRYWSEISEDAKMLIERMLTVEPIGRITAMSALQSDWIQMANEENLDQRTEEERRHHKESAKLKIKAAINSIVAAETFKSLAEDGKFADF